MGVLYKVDFIGQIGAGIENNQDIDNRTLGELIDNIITDVANGNGWNKETANKNFATLFKSDTLETAEAKMTEAGGQNNNLIRGIVLDEGDQKTVIGIVEHSIIKGEVLKKAKGDDDTGE